MKYPNRLQSAIVLDAPCDVLEEIVRSFARVTEMKSGATFAVPEQRPGTFARLFGGGADLMVTFEYFSAPPTGADLETGFASPVTEMMCPDIRARYLRAHSHILLEVSHGPMAGADEGPAFAAMASAIGLEDKGATMEAFHQRLETLALMTRIACDHTSPVVIHWKQSNQILDPQGFEALVQQATPDPMQPMVQPNALTIHPVLYASQEASGSAAEIGLVTYGLRHWLGHEIAIPATRLPWAVGFDAALALARMIVNESGPPPEDGALFSPPLGHSEGEQAWRVHQREPGSLEAESDVARAMLGDAPFIELEPLRHDPCEYVSPDYARDAQIVKLRDSTSHDEAPEDVGSPGCGADEAPKASEFFRAERAPVIQIGAGSAPSAPGGNVTGRDLRKRVFGRKES